MDGLIDSMRPDVWQEVSASDRGDGYLDVFLNGNPKQLDENTLNYVISDEDGNATNVVIKGIQANKNPLKKIGRVELKYDADKNVVGIDLNGDVVILKS